MLLRFSAVLSLLSLPIWPGNPLGATDVATSTAAEQSGQLVEDETLNDGMWIPLVGGSGPQGFVSIGKNLTLCGDVRLNPDSRELVTGPGVGVIAAVKDLGVAEDSNLLGKRPLGDCEVYLEFLIGKGSNSGVKLQQRYEIQIFDSFDKEQPSATDCGGIYPHWEFKPNNDGIRYLDQGVPPSVNAAKPAGQWQTLHVVFQSPRFDSHGKKSQNARFVKVTLNGIVVHRNVELTSPTGNASSPLPEVPQAPLYLQMDHGPVAFRNVRVKSLGVIKGPPGSAP